jgi:hypothetical protein
VSPQFRFFLAEFIFLTAILCAESSNYFTKSPIPVFSALIAAALFPIVVLFAGDFKNLTDNKFNQQAEDVKFSQLRVPEKNTKYPDAGFESHTIGNLTYYSPKPNFFFYGTADGPLPCTNVKFVDYIGHTLLSVPQLRSNDLADGFHSVPFQKNKLP